MHAKPFWITVALAALMPATAAAQQPGGNLPPTGLTPAPVAPPLATVPVPTATAADRPEVHDVYRRRTDERGQRPRHRLRRQAGQRRGGVPPLLGPDGNLRGVPGAGQPLAPRPALPTFGSPGGPKPPPDPPPG
jgi:hypothetical protein